MLVWGKAGPPGRNLLQLMHTGILEDLGMPSQLLRVWKTTWTCPALELSPDYDKFHFPYPLLTLHELFFKNEVYGAPLASRHPFYWSKMFFCFLFKRVYWIRIKQVRNHRVLERLPRGGGTQKSCWVGGWDQMLCGLQRHLHLKILPSPGDTKVLCVLSPSSCLPHPGSARFAFFTLSLMLMFIRLQRTMVQFSPRWSMTTRGSSKHHILHPLLHPDKHCGQLPVSLSFHWVTGREEFPVEKAPSLTLLPQHHSWSPFPRFCNLTQGEQVPGDWATHWAHSMSHFLFLESPTEQNY